MTKCPSFQNAQRQNSQSNILPKDKMPKVTICPRRHFAQRLYAQGDNLPKEDKMPKTTFCPFFEIFAQHSRSPNEKQLASPAMQEIDKRNNI